MTAVNEKGQVYFTFEETLETMTFIELEKLALDLTQKRNSVLNEMKLLGLKGMDWFQSPLHDVMTDYSTKLSLVLIQMNYKAWED